MNTAIDDEETGSGRSRASIANALATAPNNPWIDLSNVRRDGLLNWRHAAAAKLVDCDRDQVMEHLLSVLDEVANLTGRAVLEQRVDSAEIGFDDWLSVWRENFTHWHDPVRAILAEHATQGEGPWFVETLVHADGLVLLDWLLANLEAWMMSRSLCGGKPYPTAYARMLLGHRSMRPLEAYTLGAYSAFRVGTNHPTSAPPDAVTIPLDYDRLYPPF